MEMSMTHRAAGRMAGIVALVAICAAARAAPLEAYGTLPSLDLVRVSPDGRMVASAEVAGEKRTLVVRAVGASAPSLSLNFGAVKLRDILWAGPNHVIAL